LPDHRTTILFAIPALDKGGPDRVLFELLRGLDRSRFRPMLAVSAATGHYLEKLPEDVVVHHLPAERGALTRYPVLALARLVRRVKPDLVFATLRMAMTAGLARLFFPRGTRLILRIANQVSQNFAELQRRSPIKHRLSFRLQMLALAQADRIICQSSDMAQDLRHLGVKPPITVIGNPVEIAEVARQAVPAASLPGRPALLGVGRLTPQKGFDVLLDAMAVVRQEHPEAVLSIAGDGPDRTNLSERARQLGIESAVNFLGFIGNPYPLMAGADLFVLASRYEGFPNVCLEALAVGKPVVATDCPGGTRDVVVPGTTGWLAQPENAADLARVIAQALAESPRRDRARAARFLEQHFGAAHILAKYEAILALSAQDAPPPALRRIAEQAESS
jgi:glycosyltransferase involved in cell wall biosynthesis